MTAQELIDKLMEIVGEYGNIEVVMSVGLDGNCKYTVGKVAIDPSGQRAKLLPGGFLQ